MSKRISLKLTDKNDWLVEAIDKEQEETNRPSYRNHTCFGKVVEGLEVIDAIRQGDVMEKVIINE